MGDSRSSSSRKVVSALEEDSIEYLPSVTPSSAPHSSLQHPPPLQSPSPSLQELIEAELTARLAPLQPDSLEEDSPDGALNAIDGRHEHTHILVKSGEEVTSTCVATLDSLEAAPFSLDSLADAESGVDVSSPLKAQSETTDSSLSPPPSSHFERFDAAIAAINDSPIVPSNEILYRAPSEVDDTVPDSANRCDDNNESSVQSSSLELELDEPRLPESSKGEVVANEIAVLCEDESPLLGSSKESNKVEDLISLDKADSSSIGSGEANVIEYQHFEEQIEGNCLLESELQIKKPVEQNENVEELEQNVSSIEKSPEFTAQDSSSNKEIDQVVDNKTPVIFEESINFTEESTQPPEIDNKTQVIFKEVINFTEESTQPPEIITNGHSDVVPADLLVEKTKEEFENSDKIIKNGNLIEENINPSSVSQKEADHHDILSAQPNGASIDQEFLSHAKEETSLPLTPDVINHSNAQIINQNQIIVTSSLHSSVDVTNVKRTTKAVNSVFKTKDEAWPEESKKKSSTLDEFERMEKEVLQQMEKETKEAKEAEMNGKSKKESTEKKKKKKKKKTDSEKENKKTAYQNRDELLEKHVGPRIRSFDCAKMKSKFNKPKESNQVPSECRICGKPVFQMEKIVAEKASWHKNCFRCHECSKQLTLETYQSHEGSLYCKPHFKELFRPKAVVQDEAEERKDRLLRRPKMIVLESQPEQLPEDVVRSTAKPDYGLEELQTLDVKQRFSMFENISRDTDDQPKLESVSVRRSQSLLSKAKRFMGGDYADGELNGEGSEDEDAEEEEEEEEEENESGIIRANRKKKERPMSFSGMGDLKNAWEQKNRREELSQARKEEITRFRQLLCAGKNLSLKEKFESGNLDHDDEGEEGGSNRKAAPREILRIDSQRAKSLRERFEKGEPFIPEDEGESEEEYEEEEGEGEEGVKERKLRNRRSLAVGEKAEVEEIFKEAETAKKARNVFKQIDSKVSEEGQNNVLLRSQSFSQAPKENRFSHDLSHLRLQKTPSTAEVVKANEKLDDFSVDTTDLASRFKFFATFEKRQQEEKSRPKKVFRMTPPREGVDDQGLRTEDVEVGRDPNLIRSTDNYQDDVDCRNTRNILNMFKKLEMGPESEEEDEGPRPLKRFTPPPEDYEDESEYTDEEYTDDEEEDEDDELDENGVRRPKYRDELLEMASSQSARKAANLRAKFEKWESEVERQNDLNKANLGEDEECMPSLDTAKNLRAMFENKAVEETKPAPLQRPQKVNRFVVGGGERCVSCEKTVYAMERLEILGRILHKTCFKCFKCNTRLSMGSFSFGGDKTYCTTHYKQLFAEKGSYDAFSSQNGKWTRKIEEALNGELTKSHD